MWQRIQTLYFAIATGLVASMFFSNIATVIGPGGEELGIRYYENGELDDVMTFFPQHAPP